MTVSTSYIQRLQAWIKAEAKRCAEKEGTGDGVNAFGRETHLKLSQYGLRGFTGAQISRWIRGEVTQEIKPHTLRRFGLLRGLSKDPEEAEWLAREWLEGRSNQEFADVNPTTLSLLPLQREGVDCNLESLTPVELVQIASRIVERLGQLASAKALSSSNDHDPAPEPNPLTHMIIGFMQTNDMSLDELAQRLSVPPVRAKEIITGHLMTHEECVMAAKFIRLPVQTLMDLGGG
ncbi:hypothetical protein [Phormidium tenue]|uniref:Uncharacterized protein n=1 Tax=Phormidium tenue NIES-30 TaxID=549789 RepID=A0A1U7J7V0_9CYAN|nr:hypothetical protein [Phormidium tenue]MBD2231426.1 hypothetical protein [Phormidium tenue FACHB-1052]OKH49173.1 hypothetical protein NIES30_08440 [Phormidium tenue NIES-30]